MAVPHFDGAERLFRLKSSPFNRCRLRSVPTLCCGVALCLAASVAASADDKSNLITRLRAISEVASTGKLTVEDLFRIRGIAEPGGLLVEVGLDQLALDDLTGAQITASALPVRDKCRNCGTEEYGRFLTKLAAAIVRAGRLQAARDVLKRHYGEDEWSLAPAILGIARAQAVAGDKAGARQTCDEILRDVDKLKSGWHLLEVAQTQIKIGAPDASQTLKRVQSLIDALPSKGSERGWLLARLAVAEALRGGRKRATELLREAAQTLDPSTPDALEEARNSNCWEDISVAYARLGNFAEAVHGAGNVEPSSRGRVFEGIGIIQWINGDLDGAERTMGHCQDEESHDAILLETARARSLNGDDPKALGTMRLIKNDLRRAEATLEICTAIANRGKKREARDLARGINYLRLEEFPSPHNGRQGTEFKFDDLSTWSEPYEGIKGFSFQSEYLGEDMDGDLLASAVRCRIALDGRGAVRGPAKPYKWDVRKAARAQASEGDVAGALAWSDRLPRGRRIAAVLGAAEGYVEFQNCARRKPTSPIKLNRHLMVIRDNFLVRDLIEDE